MKWSDNNNTAVPDDQFKEAVDTLEKIAIGLNARPDDLAVFLSAGESAIQQMLREKNFPPDLAAKKAALFVAVIREHLKN
jgi:hypothetical protein